MQKKIIALAVAGLVSGAAFAQSNVTVYGVVDVFGVNAKATRTGDDQKVSGIQGGGLSGSRIGFKGVEALGNGLNAVFGYEFGTLDPTGTTNSIGNTRQAFVGLDSKTLGSIKAGRLQGIGYNFGVKYDAMGASIFSPVGQLSDSAGMQISGRDGGARLANAVSYVSPSFAGFKASVEYAFSGEAATNKSTAQAAKYDAAGNLIPQANKTYSDSATQWGLGAEYGNGPIAVGLSYLDFSDINNTVVGGVESSKKEWALGGSYDFKVVKLVASYQQAKNDNGAGTTVKGKLWNIGAGIPVGKAGKVNVAYGRYKDDAATEIKASNWGVDYEHSLSKRTTAYVGYNRMANGTNATFGLGSASGSVTPSADDNVTMFALGVRHTF